MTARAVLGLDAGGTSTRCLVADRDGVVLGHGRAGGGNPVSRPPAEAAAQIRAAVAQALEAAPGVDVGAAVFGVAGFAEDPAAALVLQDSLAGLGLHCPLQVRGDAEIAFAAGTPAPDGTALIAGTGAAASRIEAGREVRAADGWGWLLGDEGSGFWIGREAVRTALRHDRPPHGPLVAGVLAALGHPVGRAGLIYRVHESPPVALARLAPVVLEAAAAGDALAADVLARAADLLVAAVETVRRPDERTPVVLAGGIAGTVLVGDRVTERVGRRWPDAELRRVTSSEAGAAWLAARSIWPELGTDVHTRLCRPAALT
ncbi:hypothetical protein DT076_06370 [Desertihabitans brevis]|uniref:ATPase BadF/BadG/BcrA/BcrD type domain-containing protein n=1 Tax=Desertihabitans brevis TaxID=2268447 RepID=A0A367YXN0_9ACTN|nr:BadF/BadG/BcrA/BcrD ATPase family protein [Desertihabitans brevis]RCK70279.1 hypothetical protein DT076_06370 [Desertihabitans brevis]